MALRLSIPKVFRTRTSTTNLDSITFKHNNILFDTYKAKSKQFYKLLITNKASLPNMPKKLISDFDISYYLEKIYSIPHVIASETYIWSFQYKVLNYILYTKLYKIGLVLNDKCTFCSSSKEDMYHLFVKCSHVQGFCGQFTSWW